ncbi:MAG: MFS transporter [Anaerolineales bacterium]|nr:MFS transporter [Anaerolineales bacterium]
MSTLTRSLNLLRLAAFPLGYGLTGVLVGGTLNRVMIADLGFSTALVALFVAVPQLISPVRVWLGYASDGHRLFGRRREPYIVLGALTAGLGLLLAVLLVVNGAASSWLMLAGVLAAFVLYGLGRHLGHNTFEALLADTFSGKARARAVTLYEVVTLLGSVIGAGAIGGALKVYDPGRLTAVALGVAVAVFGLAVLAALGQEPRTAAARQAAERARRAPFGQVVREVVLGDPQVRLFFFIVLFTFIGTLAQDVLLEPYGALVLHMDIGQTTRLTMFWGLGVMAAMLLAGTLLVPWLGFRRVLRLGVGVSMLVFTGVIAAGALTAGALGRPGVFQALVAVMGLGTGLAGAGMLAGIITFTTPTRAGLLMGVWGMANLLGKAAGGLIGGVVVDVMRSVTGNLFLAYATVFALEVGLLGAALLLSFRLDPAASRAQREEQQALAAAAD